MKAYRLLPGGGVDGLQLGDETQRPLGAHDVRVEVKAAALNYRDLRYAWGQSANKPAHPIVPLADGIGVVMEAGAAVTRFSPGDRVITTFFPHWTEGAGSRERVAVSYGTQIDGTLAEELVTHEDGLVRAPGGLDDLLAATLTCSGVTAWNALFVQGTAKPGETVVILGTGGVSVWALLLAVAAGLHVIITSSSDEKLARAEALGARGLVNYRQTPEWEIEVLKLTSGRGADVVLEVGGENTLPRSIAAVRFGGTVVVIGGLSGFGGAKVEPGSLIGGAKRLVGISVGSRTMTEDLVRFVEVAGIKPVVDRTFSFAEAPRAYTHLQAGQAFGKVVVSMT